MDLEQGRGLHFDPAPPLLGKVQLGIAVTKQQDMEGPGHARLARRHVQRRYLDFYRDTSTSGTKMP